MVGCELALRLNRGRDGVRGVAKDAEESVSLRVDDLTAVERHRSFDHIAVPCKSSPILVAAHLLQQACRGLDVGEEKRDRP